MVTKLLLVPAARSHASASSIPTFPESVRTLRIGSQWPPVFSATRTGALLSRLAAW